MPSTALAGTDVFPVVDVSASTTNKVSVEDLLRNAPDGTAGSPSIANAGDQDTGILFPADNSVGVSTGGTQRLVIDSSGNCGIEQRRLARFHLTLLELTMEFHFYSRSRNKDSRHTV